MELVFFDLETTFPPAVEIIEFGAVVLDKDGLYEKESYSTLIWSGRVDNRSIECNGITPEILAGAPTFADVAGKIYEILNGRIWAGHNIKQFDIPKLISAFGGLCKPAPVPLTTIDTYRLLQRTFGKRAGNMKLASLGSYFGLGKERHRAIEDIRMNIEVVKMCSTILFLEENTGYSSVEIPKEKIAVAEEVPTIKLLADAMAAQQDIWISYDGGSNPLMPRKIRPLRWVFEPWLIEAYCHQSQVNKNFTFRKIAEARQQEWTVIRKEEEPPSDSEN
jgi:DNA polymerase III epsilon subunit-like protein